MPLRTRLKRSALLAALVAGACAPAGAFDMSEDGIELRSTNGRVELEISGRLHLDAALLHGDSMRLDEGAEARRARLGAKLGLPGDFELEYTYDFTNGGRVLEASLSYAGCDRWEIRIGQFRERFSLDELTSSNHITFMERALPNEFAPGYNSGVALSIHGDNWSAAGGFFGDRIIKDVFGAGDEVRSATARFTLAPLHHEREVWHLGLSLSAREIGDDGSVRFRIDPESFIADENLVRTGSIQDVDTVYLAGAETALVKGPVSLQSEYILSHLNREGGRSDLNFKGWYAFVSWFLTGESRPYRANRGSFGRLTPNRETGAWEIGFRVSHLDLNDRTIDGGRERNTTLGLSWYYRRNTRLMANFVHVETDDASGNRNVDILQARAQFYL